MHTEQIVLYTENQVIQNAVQQNLLGVIIDKNLSWDKQINYVCLKVQMTKIYILAALFQLWMYCFKEHNAENRMHKFQLAPEI